MMSDRNQITGVVNLAVVASQENAINVIDRHSVCATVNILLSCLHY